MVNQLKTGSDFLVDQQKAFESESVVYTRGAYRVTLQAMTELQEFVIEEEGTVVTGRSRDFKFQPADLILNGVVEKPQRDDRITYDGDEYEVVPIGGGDDWEWTNGYKNQIRVHTQEVKTG